MHKKNQGTLGEALVVAQIVQNNCSAFTDFGDNSKIDIIVEDLCGELHKVQVKCNNREKKSPEITKFSLVKRGPNGYKMTYHGNMVDWFAIVDMKTNNIAWISFDEIGKLKDVTFRHSEPKNNQRQKIRRFDDYTKFPF